MKVVDYYEVLKWAIWNYMAPYLLVFTVHAVASEALSVFYNYFIGEMIYYLEDPNSTMVNGILYCLIFGSAQFISLILRSYYVNYGFVMSVRLRKVMTAALYNKTIKLSMKSMTETNSGKLISLINGDLLQVEIGISFAPLLLAAPFINLIAYVFIATKLGVLLTLIPLGSWLALIAIQHCVSELTKKYKMKEA